MTDRDEVKADFMGTALACGSRVDVYFMPTHMGVFTVPPGLECFATANVNVEHATVTDSAFGCRSRNHEAGGVHANIAVPWISVYFMQRTDGEHLIDWQLMSSLVGNAECFKQQREYRRVLPDAHWPLINLSIGHQIDFRLGQAPSLEQAAGAPSDDGGQAILRARARWGYAQRIGE